MLFKRKYHFKDKFLMKSSNWTYYCYVKLYFDDDGVEMFELDVYDNPTFWNDGIMKHLGEANHIGGYEDEPFDDYEKPVDLARAIIKQHEQKIKLRNAIKKANGVFELDPKPREKGNVVQIFDHEEMAARQTKEYYLRNIEELDQMRSDERARLFVDYPEIKKLYREYRNKKDKGAI